MGYGFPAAIGAQFANPKKAVWAIVGDGGFQMTLAELATAAIHKLPVKVLIINKLVPGHWCASGRSCSSRTACRASIWKATRTFVKLAGAYGIKPGASSGRPRSIGF